jgi:hypothetical protein
MYMTIYTTNGNNIVIKNLLIMSAANVFFIKRVLS